MDGTCTLLNSAAQFADALAQSTLHDSHHPSKASGMWINASVLKLTSAVLTVETYERATGCVTPENDVTVSRDQFLARGGR